MLNEARALPLPRGAFIAAFDPVWEVVDIRLPIMVLSIVPHISLVGTHVLHYMGNGSLKSLKPTP